MSTTPLLHIGSWSHLKSPELIVPEAFEQHPQRIQRQIATATDTPLPDVVAIFDEVCAQPSERGAVTVRTLVDYSDAVDCSLYVYEGRRLLMATQRENHHKKSLVVNLWNNTLYVYREAAKSAAKEAAKERIDPIDRPL